MRLKKWDGLYIWYPHQNVGALPYFFSYFHGEYTELQHITRFTFMQKWNIIRLSRSFGQIIPRYQ